MLIIKEIFGYFLIGLIGMLGLSILYLPVYFILRKRMSLMRQAAYFLFAVCILVILSATVLDGIIMNKMDGKGIITENPTLNMVLFHSFTENWLMGERKKITQILANVLMFVPLGFIYPIAFPKTRRLWKTTIGMALFSFLIEFIQYFIGRCADIDDLVLNTMGGVLGYFAFYMFLKLWKLIKRRQKGSGSSS